MLGKKSSDASDGGGKMRYVATADAILGSTAGVNDRSAAAAAGVIAASDNNNGNAAVSTDDQYDNGVRILWGFFYYFLFLFLNFLYRNDNL